MLISLDWLKQYVEIKEDIKQLENTLTMIGQEVEAINIQGKNLDNIVIGEIVEYDRHPESDKLTLLKVNIGEEILQIVCGAPNHKLGDKVVVAKIGAILPGDFKIKKSKIRGIESFGMLCSEVELGIGEDNDGIIILPSSAPIGQEYKEYAELDDVIFELEITPNRPDCLSHIGIAREVAAYYGRKVKYPNSDVAEVIESTGNSIKVTIEDKERCKRYSARIIKNVKVEESPKWLKKRLRSIGLRPINNIVDITNFVMFEYNHPLHAFDLNKIKGNEIKVRKAHLGETLITLDGKERILNNEELVVADSENALAIAGIMGGESSMVTEATKDILLEVAYFSPDNIRRTSKNIGLSSDSSYRFERGVDIEDAVEVLDRAAHLIALISNGEILDGIVDEYVEKFKRVEIPLNIDKLRSFMGKEIEYSEVGRILANLGLEIRTLTQEMLVVTPPSYRSDLTRPEDLYEEVIRIYGFENIEAVMPIEDITAGEKDKVTALTDRAKETLYKIGLQEVINYSFISKKAIELLKISEKTVEILNPISDDMAIMRPTLMYSLLGNIRDNLNRNQNNLKFYEVSKTFRAGEDLPIEELKIGIALAGKEGKNLWNPKPKVYDFYSLKGYVEKFLELMGVNKYQLERSEDRNLHPGRSADIKIGKYVIGSFGEIHPELAEKMGIDKERVYFGEINLSLLSQYMGKTVKYEKIIKYPEVTRDLAIVLNEDILIGNMINDINKISNLIESVELFDIYTGEGIEKGKKSVAISIVLRKKNGTLDEKEITETVDKILELIRKNYQGEIRQ
jgi:phenylalanyl-tRNA synthetase beta chain